RNATRERADHVHGDARIVWRARPRRDAQMSRRERLRRRDVDGVVTEHPHVRAEHEKRLHEVVGEGVVVVDEQELHVHMPSSASWSARTAEAFLASTSACSASGTLSATMPPPA